MKALHHRHLPWRVIAIPITCSLFLTSSRADEKKGTKSAPRQIAANLSPEEPEIAKAVRAPAIASIDRIETSTVDRQVEVRIIGSGELSCSPSNLVDPARLVLDCAAQMRARSAPARVDESPVRSIRVGQFKTDVARVVVDLERLSAYDIRRDGNSLVVSFNRLPTKPSTVQPASNHSEPTPDPLAERQDPAPLTPVPTQTVNLPPVKSEETSPAALPDPDHAEKPSQDSVSPVAEQSRPAMGASIDLTPSDASATEPDSPIENFDSSSGDQDYVIGVQDVLAINVWRDPELSRSVPVRPDGKISLPLIGDLHVSGLTPRMLQDRLTKELDAYIRKPKVTVIVQEMNSRKFYIMGMVERPGAFALATHVTVLDALAMSGGFRDFARVNQIYLLHVMPDGSRKRIPFNFKAAVLGNSPYRDIEIQPGDTLVVP